MKYTIVLIFFMVGLLASCKDKANLAKLENEENLGKRDEHLIDDSEKLVELSDLILTGISISGHLIENESLPEQFHTTVEFLNKRNNVLYDDIAKTAEILEITVLKQPSETNLPEIEKFEGDNANDILIDNYKNWLKSYSANLDVIATWMIQSSDNRHIIDLGAKVNSYCYALKRELELIKEIS